MCNPQGLARWAHGVITLAKRTRRRAINAVPHVLLNGRIALQTVSNRDIAVDVSVTIKLAPTALDSSRTRWRLAFALVMTGKTAVGAFGFSAHGAWICILWRGRVDMRRVRFTEEDAPSVPQHEEQLPM